jgi:ribonuclease HI
MTIIFVNYIFVYNTVMITIYCDGSSRGNPGPGGYGVVIIGENNVIEFGKHFAHTTNNKMELQGAIDALVYLKDRGILDSIEIHTDSQYVIKGITEWIHGWKNNNFRTSAKKPVLNEELWRSLDDIASSFHVKWKYVKGHAGIPGNERADSIATAFADKEEIALFVGKRNDYCLFQ